MNIGLLCALIIITGATDGIHVQNARTSRKEETGQSILLRKLQAFQQDDPKETKTATWNQILADAFVNRFKIFTFITSENAPSGEVKSNSLTNCISQMMQLYKTLIYDKFINKRIENTSVKHDENTEQSDKTNREQNKNVNEEVSEIETVAGDPKDEVEIVEPRYHGKLCDGCAPNTNTVETSANGTDTVEITKVETVTDCPDGLVVDEDGRCTNPKSKFILSIPFQCPIGYRRDWLGYCRPPL